MKTIRFFLKFISIFFVIIVVFWVGLLATLQTKSGQKWALKQTIKLVYLKTGLKLEPEKVEFIFPLSLRISHMTIAKDSEKFAEIRQLEIDCLAPYLLQGRLVLSNLSAKQLTILSSGQHSRQHMQSDQPDWTPLSFYLKIEKIHFDQITVAPPIMQLMNLSQEYAHFQFQLTGMLSNNPLRNSIRAHLQLNANDPTQRFAPIQLRINLQSRQLSLSLHSKQLPLIASEFKPSLDLYTSAPLSIWKNLIETKDADGIEGKFKMTLPEKQAVLKSRFRLRSLEEVELFKTVFTSPVLKLQGESVLNLHEVRRCHFSGEMTYKENEAFLQGMAHGPYANLLMDIEANSPQLLIQEQLIHQVRTSISASHILTSPEGLMELEFESNGIPCQTTAAFKWDSEQDNLYFSRLIIDVLQNQLIGNLTFSPSRQLVEGYLKMHAAQLSPLAQLAGISAEGQLNADFIFKIISEGSDLHQSIDCEIKGEHIDWQDLTIQQVIFDANWNQKATNLTTCLNGQEIQSKQLKIKNAAIEIDWQNFWNHPEGLIRFNCRDITQDSFSVDELQGKSTFSTLQPNGKFSVKASGQYHSSWEIGGEGDWNFSQNQLDMHLHQFQGSYANAPIQLLHPILFTYKSNEMQLSPLDIQWGEGKLSAAFSLLDERLSLNFKTNSISSELWRLINPRFSLIGHTSLIGHLEGSLKNPTGEIKFELQDVQISEEHLAKRAFLKGIVLLGIDPNGMTIRSQLFGIGKNPLILQGILPFQLSFDPFVLKEEETLPFNLDIFAEGDLDTYLHHFLVNFPNISGLAKMALKLKGRMQQPQIYGTLEINQAIYESQDAGTIYKNIHAQLEGNGSTILLKSLSAEDSHGGTISGNGSIEIDSKQEYPYQFNIQASHLYILNSDYASISASGPLTLIGKKSRGKLQGNLNVEKAIVRLEEALPKQIKTIDINYFNIPEGQQPHQIETNSGSPIDLDIKLHAKEVIVEGNHLKSLWKGTVNIAGNTSQPLLFGDLWISNGEYDLKGKLFNLTQGSIHFAGSPAKKTSLYVVASKEIDPIKVEMIVKGPVNKLGVSFRSTPPMSQREVLSYILFGRGISDISHGEGDTLNQSFMALNASDSSEEKQDLLSRLRNNIGIDRLDFSASGEGANRDVSVQVGKYIWKDVLISLNKSIGAASDRVAMEAKIMKNMKAQAEMDIGSSAQGKISLKWKRDY